MCVGAADPSGARGVREPARVLRRGAYQPGPHDLVLSHFTLAREHPIEDRVRLAAENGFGSIGLFVGQYAQLEADGFAPNAFTEEKNVFIAH